MFGIDSFSSNVMDPQVRMLHEVVYETIVDAGIDPNDLRGTRTGIFIGLCADDTTVGVREDFYKVVEYLSFPASQISNSLGLTGPGLLFETACASTFSALNEAILLLKAGYCDNMLVAGTSIHLRPSTSLAFLNLKMLSSDGRSKCLDAKADGYTRSETVASVLIQRKSKAKRIYAEILNCRTSCDGYKTEGITYPSYPAQCKLMKEVYSELGRNPLDLEYIEAHITGTPAGDPVECKSTVEALRPNSNKPLLFGCVKSNAGHSEGASGILAISKALKIFQTGLIPPNLYYSNPNPKIEGLLKGIVKPVLETTKKDLDLIAFNSFGFGGVNVHALFENKQPKMAPENYQIADNIPRLINLCNRTQSGIEFMFTSLGASLGQISRDQLRLLQDVCKISPESGFKYRGSLIIDQNQKVTKSFTKIEAKKPLGLFFSNFDNQWFKVGHKLMKLSPFCNSIDKSDQIVAKFGYNLIKIIKGQEQIDAIRAVLATLAVQIALIDLLVYLEIEIDCIIGYSFGELAAAYADNCATREQVLKCALIVIQNIINNQVEKGLMAEVLLPFVEARRRCPSQITVGHAFNLDKTIISGSAKAVSKLISKLKEENIKVKELNSFELGFHSDHVQSAYQSINLEVSKVITDPQKRSLKWINFENSLNQYDNQHFTSTYVANMIVSQLQNYKAFEELDFEGFLIEIGPQHLVSSTKTSSLSMVSQSFEDPVYSVLKSVGSIYRAGHWPRTEKLYPKVEYPVSRGTPCLGHLIKWDHSRSWHVCKFPEYFNIFEVKKKKILDTILPKSAFLIDHCIDGRLLLPATCYLENAWETVATTMGFGDFHTMPFEMWDVSLHRAVLIAKGAIIHLDIQINKNTHQFTITEHGSLCVTGYCRFPKQPVFDYKPYLNANTKSDAITLDSKDVYKSLRIRGYHYGPRFQNILEVKSDGSYSKVKYSEHWVSFADACLQTLIVGINEKGLFVPTHVDYMRCDPDILYRDLEKNKQQTGVSQVDVYFNRDTSVLATNGLIFKGIKAMPISQKKDNQNKILGYVSFVPCNYKLDLDNDNQKSIKEYSDLCLQCLNKLKDGNFEMTNRTVIKNTVASRNNQCTLLRSLFDCLELKEESNLDDQQVKAVLEKTLTQSQVELSFDLIINKVTASITLHQIDLIYENLNSRSVTSVELNSSFDLLSDYITNRNNQFDLEGQTIVFHPFPDHSMMKSKEFTFKELNEKFLSVDPCDILIYKDHRTMLNVTRELAEKEVDLNYLFEKFFKSVNIRGFLLLYFRNGPSLVEEKICDFLDIKVCDYNNLERIKHLAESVGFTSISESTFQSWNCLLFRKLLKKTELKENICTVQLDPLAYRWIEKVQEKLYDNNVKRLWLMSTQSEINGTVGLINCLRKEPGGDKVRCFFNGGGNDEKSLTLTSDVIEKDLIINVVEDNQLGSYRENTINSFEDPITLSKDVYLNMKVKGDLTSFRWYQSNYSLWKTLPNDIVYIYYSALNFKDVMLATGRLNLSAYPVQFRKQDFLGIEFSGIDGNGRRVMGISDSKCIASSILNTSTQLRWEVPDHWTMKEAATVPVCYVTAYYSLIVRGHLQHGESVLIHAGSGGVGQAAISICLKRGCEVFTTVGTKEKREFLKNKFPQLDDNHIGNSRSIDFEHMVMRVTNGRGVDVILNSLSDEKLQASVRCLADFGRFLEIGKYDIVINSPFGELQ